VRAVRTLLARLRDGPLGRDPDAAGGAHGTTGVTALARQGVPSGTSHPVHRVPRPVHPPGPGADRPGGRAVGRRRPAPGVPGRGGADAGLLRPHQPAAGRAVAARGPVAPVDRRYAYAQADPGRRGRPARVLAAAGSGAGPAGTGRPVHRGPPVARRGRAAGAGLRPHRRQPETVPAGLPQSLAGRPVPALDHTRGAGRAFRGPTRHRSTLAGPRRCAVHQRDPDLRGLGGAMMAPVAAVEWSVYPVGQLRSSGFGFAATVPRPPGAAALTEAALCAAEEKLAAVRHEFTTGVFPALRDRFRALARADRDALVAAARRVRRGEPLAAAAEEVLRREGYRTWAARWAEATAAWR